MNIPIGSEYAISRKGHRRIIPIRYLSASFFYNETAGADIPGLQSKFPKPLETTHGHKTEIQGGSYLVMETAYERRCVEVQPEDYGEFRRVVQKAAANTQDFVQFSRGVKS